MPEPKPRNRGKTPTAEKVERRLVEQWGVIRRKPQYREARKTAQEAQLAISALEGPLASYEPGPTPSGLQPKPRPGAIDQLRAQLTHAMETLESFGIDADPDDPTPVQLFDLLTPTHTNYSIDTREVISGAYLLYETPWERDWSKGREAFLLLDPDPQVPLEEVRAGVEHVIRFRAPYWRKARQILGNLPVRSISLIGPTDPGWEPVWEMLMAIGAEPWPALIIDPMIKLGQLRSAIHTTLTTWGKNRGRPGTRWRRTTAGDIQTFDAIQAHLNDSGNLPTRGELAGKLGYSSHQARRAAERASLKIAAPQVDATLQEHVRKCARCDAGRPCRVLDRLLEQTPGTRKSLREPLGFSDGEDKPDGGNEPET